MKARDYEAGKRMKRKTATQLFFLFLLVLLSTLPFINKPYHVDDTIFLRYSQSLANEFFPVYTQEFRLVGIISKGLNLIDPPFFIYYNTIPIKLFGMSEIPMHLFYIPFAIIIALSVYFISRRFVKNYYICTLLSVFSPAFLVMFHNLMLDIPMIAFFLLGLSLFIYGTDKESNKILLLASVFASLAPLIKYNGLLIVPLAMIYFIIKKKNNYLLYAVIPVAAVLLFELYNYSVYGVSHILYSALDIHGPSKGINLEFFAVRLLTILIYTGAISIFTIFFIYPIIKRKKAARYILALSVFLSLIISIAIKKISSGFFSGKYSNIEIFLLWVFISAGIFYMVMYSFCFYESFRERKTEVGNYGDFLFLFLWLASSVLGNILFAGGAVRYFAISLIPLALILFTLLEKNIAMTNSQISKFGRMAFIATLALSISIAYADYQYASVYRDFPKKLSSTGAAADEKIYFFGDFGFGFYMEREGYKYIVIQNITQEIEQAKKDGKGIMIVKPQILFPRDANKLYFNNELKVISTSEYTTKFPLRVHNYMAHAGFYTFSSGLLPYTFSSEPIEIFYVYYIDN